MVHINTGWSPANITIDKHKIDYRGSAVIVGRHCNVFYVAAVKFKFKWNYVESILNRFQVAGNFIQICIRKST